MWCFIVTSSKFEVFELTFDYVRRVGPRPADTVKEALDGVLDIVRSAYCGLDVAVGFKASFDQRGYLCGVVDVRLPWEEDDFSDVG